MPSLRRSNRQTRQPHQPGPGSTTDYVVYSAREPGHAPSIAVRLDGFAGAPGTADGTYLYRDGSNWIELAPVRVPNSSQVKQWFSPELGRPVAIQYHGPGAYIEVEAVPCYQTNLTVDPTAVIRLPPRRRLDWLALLDDGRLLAVTSDRFHFEPQSRRAFVGPNGGLAGSTLTDIHLYDALLMAMQFRGFTDLGPLWITRAGPDAVSTLGTPPDQHKLTILTTAAYSSDEADGAVTVRPRTPSL